MSHANPETEEGTRCLDEALEDTFPASDPPSMTSPMAATPSSDVIAEAPGPLRVYRVVDAGHASEPFAPVDSGGRWTPAGSACVYTSLSPACALLEYLAMRIGEVVRRSELLEHVWKLSFDPGSNVVDVHVAQLRKRLREAGSTVDIRTARNPFHALEA